MNPTLRRIFPILLVFVISAQWIAAAEEIPIAELPLRAAAAATAGKTKEAVELYAQWVDRDPLNPLARANYGAALFQANDLEKSRNQLERAVLIEPKLATSWATLGLIYDRAGEDWLALSAYSRAVHLEPRVARHRILVALAMEKRGWREAAESSLREAAEMDPESADAQFNLAALALRRTPPATETARRHYTQAIKLGAAPDPDIEDMLGMTKAKEGDDTKKPTGKTSKPGKPSKPATVPTKKPKKP